MYSFKSIGNHVTISPKASIYGAGNIEIGNNVRIDDFCILSAGEGGIKIGSHVHIANSTQIIGHAPIIIEDFVQISSQVAIFSSSDDFSGLSMVGPCIPNEFKNVTSESVKLERHVLLGNKVTVLPGVTIHEGTAIGAMSLVKDSIGVWQVYSGVPAKRKGRRSKDILKKENEFMQSLYLEQWQ
jgi:galactoside O-acetyltransferase